MSVESLNQYKEELEITFRNENYLVRDNGSVFRLSKSGKSIRKFDNIWTFGNVIGAGYRHISSHAIHQIVAIAFLGNPPSENQVVDHINTIREDNRPENLRWLTRSENLYENPITLRRIESIWGSVPNMLNHFKTVSPETTSESLKVNAIQRRWKTPCEFSLCPTLSDEKLDQSGVKQILHEYMEELEFGTVFSKNRYNESITILAEMAKKKQNEPALIVLSKFGNNGVKNWAVARVTIEDGVFVHENEYSCFTLQGALKKHCELVGVSFEESIDDHC